MQTETLDKPKISACLLQSQISLFVVKCGACYVNKLKALLIRSLVTNLMTKWWQDKLGRLIIVTYWTKFKIDTTFSYFLSFFSGTATSFNVKNYNFIIGSHANRCLVKVICIAPFILPKVYTLIRLAVF